MKIVTLDKLLELRQRARGDGRIVVHCHGCFDIVHPGHIHHLQFARSQGDLLVVTVSADTHVNKGVNRPLIPDDLRARSLAALECVDAVYINSDPTAVALLEQLRPDIYVKGREYERNGDPRFLAERDSVMHHGGRVVFSSGDIVYSSTALIQSLTDTETFNGEKLARLRRRHGLDAEHLHSLVRQFRGRRVVVVGDYLLDRYHHCDAVGVAGEGPMLSLRALRQEDFDGGAAVIALHLAGLGAVPTLATGMGEDPSAESTLDRLGRAGVVVRQINQRRRTTTKHRYLVDQTKLFKVDEGSSCPLDSSRQHELAGMILDSAQDADAVIFADFGYGVITAGLLDEVLEPLRKSVPILSADVSGDRSSLLRFAGVDLLCPTEREVRSTLHDFAGGLGAVASQLLHATGARRAMITLGKQGLVTFEPPAPPRADGRLDSEYWPALSTQAIDPIGCGDALLATSSLALASGGSLQAAAFLGSVAAAIECRRLGNHPINSESLLDAMHAMDAEPHPMRLAS